MTDLGLDGKVALVGGGSSGIGFGIAKALAAEGALVTLMARRQDRLDDAVARLNEVGGENVASIQADCGSADDCSRSVNTVVSRHGRIDILINNDGGPPLGPADRFDDAAWYKAIDRHLLYVVRSCREALPQMRYQRSGSILNVISLVAAQPRRNFVLPSTVWAAVLAYSKTLSLEVAEFGINVNSILSGRFDTERLDVVHDPEGKNEQLRSKLAAEVPAGRLGSVEEFSNLALLLVSQGGNYITGTGIQIDGGMLAGLR